MRNSEKILKVASELRFARKERIESIVAPLRKKAQAAGSSEQATAGGPTAPTFNALATEAKNKGKYALGKFKNFGTNDPVGGGAASGAVLGGIYGLISEALRSRREGEKKNYLRSMLTHAIVGTAGGALLGNYRPNVVKDGLKSLPS